MTKTERIQEAAYFCRENARQTLVDRLGVDPVKALSFNDYENAVAEECISQASCFADQFGVGTQEVLFALHLVV